MTKTICDMCGGVIDEKQRIQEHHGMERVRGLTRTFDDGVKSFTVSLYVSGQQDVCGKCALELFNSPADIISRPSP